MTTAAFTTYTPDWVRPVRDKWGRLLRDPQDDFYQQVPKGFDENLAFRRWLLDEGERDEEFAENLWIACSRDLLFWVNSFCWLMEQREGVSVQHEHKIFPWITWPVQDWLLTEMQASMGKENFIGTKCRAAAFSWCFVAACFHGWNFRYGGEYGLVSASEEKVDAISDPSSLFGKADILRAFMPEFLLRKDDVTRGPLRLVHHDNRTAFHGYAATGNADRGGRKRVVGLDEHEGFPRGQDYDIMETLGGVSDSLFQISTFGKRSGCAFNVTAQDPDYPAKRVRVTWRDCPPYWAGAYTTGPDGSAKILNEKNPPPADYRFILDGRVRSPYFDVKTAGKSKQFIARELEADIESASTPALNRQVITDLRDKHGAPPTARGSITYGADYKLTFHPDANGPLSLWTHLPGNKPPKNDVYAMGDDVSGGHGASNSVISVMSRTTGKQLAEYVTATDDAIALANISLALGLWFDGEESAALLNFDAQGQTGRAFAGEIKRIEYPNIMARRTNDRRHDQRTQKIGTPASVGYGPYLMDVLEACQRGECEIRSLPCYKEFGEYVWVKGKIEHGGAISGKEESEGRDTHGDRAVAAALAWIACQSSPRVVEEKKELPPVSYGSLAWWREKVAKQNAEGDLLYPEEAEVA